MDNYNKKLERAEKRVKDIKGFYTHALVYVLVNIFIAVAHYIVEHRFVPDGDLSGWSYLTTPVGWGVGLLVHGLWVFGLGGNNFLRSWEKRKIDQLMKEEKEEFENFKRFD